MTWKMPWIFRLQELLKKELLSLDFCFEFFHAWTLHLSPTDVLGVRPRDARRGTWQRLPGSMLLKLNVNNSFKKNLYLFQTNNYINYNKNELSKKEMKERNIHITSPNFKTIRSSRQNYCQIAIKFPKCGLSNTTLTWLWTGKNCLNSRPYLTSCPKRFEPCWVSTGALYGHGVQPSH